MDWWNFPSPNETHSQSFAIHPAGLCSVGWSSARRLPPQKVIDALAIHETAATDPLRPDQPSSYPIVDCAFADAGISRGVVDPERGPLRIGDFCINSGRLPRLPWFQVFR